MNTSAEFKETSLRLKKGQIIFLIIFSIILLLLGIFLTRTDANEELFTQNNFIYNIFNILTQAGSEYFYIVLFAFIYISWDKEFTQKLLINFTLITLMTNFFKQLFQDPRPSTNIINGEPKEEGYGFPSGHTSSTTSVWSLIYLKQNEQENKKIKYVIQGIAIFFLITVPISRMIIGVHDLEDIIGGYLLAIMITTLFIVFYPKLEQNEWSSRKSIIVYSTVSLLIWIVSVLLLVISDPSDWLEQAESIAQTGGMLLGMSIAIPLERKCIDYNSQNFSISIRILGGIISVIITLGVYFGLTALLKPLPGQFILRGVRYGLLTGVLILLLPWMITKFFKQISDNHK